MADEEPKTFTQDEVNSLLAKTKREHKDELAKFADYDDLKTQVGTLTSERDSAVAERDQATTRATEAETTALRYTVAGTKGLDISLAPRLKGSTKEELEADADDFLSRLPKPKAPKTPTAPPAPKDQEPEKGRAAAALRQLRNQG